MTGAGRLYQKRIKIFVRSSLMKCLCSAFEPAAYISCCVWIKIRCNAASCPRDPFSILSGLSPLLTLLCPLIEPADVSLNNLCSCKRCAGIFQDLYSQSHSDPQAFLSDQFVTTDAVLWFRRLSGSRKVSVDDSKYVWQSPGAFLWLVDLVIIRVVFNI